MISSPGSRHATKCEQHRFGGPCGDYYIVDIHIDVKAMVIVGKLAPQRQQTFRGTVLQNLAVDLFQCVQPLL